MSDELVKLIVDVDSCIAGGQCEMLEPETFLVDDDTAIASVIGTGMLPPDRAAQVVERCPASAISIGTAPPSDPDQTQESD